MDNVWTGFSLFFHSTILWLMFIKRESSETQKNGIHLHASKANLGAVLLPGIKAINVDYSLEDRHDLFKNSLFFT